MAKQGELDYVRNMSTVLGVPLEEVELSLSRKPYPYERRGFYLIDLGEVFRLLPPPPIRLLDLGCGSGWTSKMFAMAGYVVVGMDVCSDMIDIARRECVGLPAEFHVQDYETEIDPSLEGNFDGAVIYDALHHAIDEARLIANVYGALKPGGFLLTAEPGRGHAESADTRREAERWGTTEKDMPYEYQKALMLKAGFRDVEQYLRLSELPLCRIDHTRNNALAHFSALLHNTTQAGFTSICIARRD